MFLRPSILNKLMKQAYKNGLTVARTEDDWLYIAGSYWAAGIEKEFIPKRTLGDIIALVGELPGPGERFSATKEGNQLEIEASPILQEEPFRAGETLTVTDVVLIGTNGTEQRLLQDESTGNIYVVNNVFVNIVNNMLIDTEHGEYSVTKPFFHPSLGILWRNNVCKLRAIFRSDTKNDKVLENLKGVDITPEVAS